jgi:hypothetical protein
LLPQLIVVGPHDLDKSHHVLVLGLEDALKLVAVFLAVLAELIDQLVELFSDVFVLLVLLGQPCLKPSLHVVPLVLEVGNHLFLILGLPL